MYRIDGERFRANLAELRRTARPRRAARRPGAPAVARAADARRHRGRAAARPRGALPRRADDRPRRGQQGPRCASSCEDLNAERQATVLLTTHDLTDIEQLCSRVMVIDHGPLVYDGSLTGLHALGGATGRWWSTSSTSSPAAPASTSRGPACARSTARGSGWLPRRRLGRAGGRGRRRVVRRRRPVHPRAGHRGRDRRPLRSAPATLRRSERDAALLTHSRNGGCVEAMMHDPPRWGTTSRRAATPRAS